MEEHKAALVFLMADGVGVTTAGRLRVQHGSFEEALLALEVGAVDLLSAVRVRYTGELIDLTTVYDDQDILHTEIQVVERQLISTTIGRILFNAELPEGIPYINGLLKKKGLGQLVQFCYLYFSLK